MKQATNITTGGKELPFSFGMAALSRFMDSQGIDLAGLGEMTQGMTLTGAMSLVWHGFADGHRRANLPFSLTLDDIGDMMDEDDKLLERCMKVFLASMPKYANEEPAKTGNLQKPVQKMRAR